jgi:hypothetical protein
MPIYVWIKVMPNRQPTEIICEPDDNINRLKIKIKDQLSPDFDQVARHRIIIRDADGVIIDPGVGISSYGETLGYSSKHPFLVDAPALNTSSGKPSLPFGQR